MPAAPVLDWLPAADLSRRFDKTYPGGTYPVEKLLLHSTETPPTAGCPGYQGGASAPHLTISAWEGRRFVYQHFPLTMSARALADPTSTKVRENRDGVVQVELVGYSDKAKGPDWYLPDLTGDDLDWLAQVLAPIVATFSIPLVRPARWLTYPASYGLTPARMTAEEYDAFRGVLGHQHAPGNLHGDPTMDVDGLLARLGGITAPKPPPPPKTPPKKETPVAIQTPPFPGTSFMTNGRSSTHALLVGQALVKAGFKGYRQGPSRVWGPADTAGVRWYQKKIGDAVDGKLGPKQWAKLLSVLGKVANPKTSPKYVRPITLGPLTQITQRWDAPNRRYASGEHNGVDIAAPHGTPIRATIGGRVVRYGTEGGYGRRLVIKGDDGLFWAYNHTSAALVRAGQRVSTRQVVARVGSTGKVTGPHLCLEAYPSAAMRYNTDVNPNRWP